MSKKKSKNPEFRGMLEFIGDKNFGFIRELRHDLRKGDSDPFCSPPVIR